MSVQAAPFDIVPMLQVRPGMLLAYDQVLWHSGRPSRDNDSGNPNSTKPEPPDRHDVNKEKTYAGQLTAHSKKRLTKAINLLVAQALPKTAINFKTGDEFKFRVNFVTLTLPAPQGAVSDKEIKKTCLDNWLKTMRYRHNLNSYVWRAERQFNGNIHFHITTDTYLPYDQICNVWNHQLSKFHFIDEFEAANDHRHPNSTDVHSVQGVKNLAAYMVKYCSKDPEEHLKEVNQKRRAIGDREIIPEDHPWRKIEGQPEWNQPINGKVWDCSQNLKTKETCSIEIDSDAMQCLNFTKDNFPENCSSFDHCWCAFLSEHEMQMVLTARIFNLYQEYLSRIRRHAPPVVVVDKTIQITVDPQPIDFIGTQTAFDFKVKPPD